MFPFPVATALRQTFRQGYGRGDFMADLFAGLVVSLVALPLSMALAIAVGLPPQHGIITAVVAGFVAAVLGGSPTQVSGPTAAFVVIIAPIVAESGLRGLVIATFLAGIMLVLMGIARMGRLIAYIPHTVTTAFTAGIAVVLATLSLADFLGLRVSLVTGHYHDKVLTLARALPATHLPALAVGMASLIALRLWARVPSRIPGTVVSVVAGMGAAWLAGQAGYPVELLGDRYPITNPADFLPRWHFFGEGTALFAWPTIEELRPLVVSAAVIAALAALESLLSATIADSMAGTRHSPNAELIGIGVANSLSALSGGIAATGALARTATNIRSGARSPVAAIIHAALILLYVAVLFKVIALVPMATLAALLINTAIHMSHGPQFVRIFRYAPRSERLTLVVCFTLTVLMDMVAGITVGVVMSALLFVRRVASLTEVQMLVNGAAGEEERQRAVFDAPPGVMIYSITGPLFFGTAEKAFERTGFLEGTVHTMIIDIGRVPLMDVTAMHTLEDMIARLHRRGVRTVLCGDPHLIHSFTHELTHSLPPDFSTASSIAEALHRLPGHAKGDAA